ncbi:Putative ribonuclease III domain-containing protein [Septoria linicola]|uniref:Ribonuclease III domain-containing protein n=1 Tax=Septoria linicola TaxID=215465 RepID=A0A9Q9ASC3_9PEZI|nr:putative ribonuclease III domain-containing protein [Septoria linicola]USW51147.1 Putative ribonuclease III domain-containing protein [Septoria linicola]
MSNKRPHHGEYADAPKRQRSERDRDSYRSSYGSGDYDRRDRQPHSRHDSERHSRGELRVHHDHDSFTPNPAISHSQAVNDLPPSTLAPHCKLPPQGVSSSVGTDLPELPPAKEEYREASFRHKSHYSTSRELATGDVTYERLEFLGDAYLELYASRLIYGRYSHLPAGRMSQLRELLVKNETLAEYSRAYGFDKRVEVGHEIENMKHDSRGRGNKGFNKIIGDVFEAYLAAVVLSDFDGKGNETAEKWCVALWAPKLLKAAQEDPSYTYKTRQAEADPSTVYDVEAKPKLQKRLCAAGLVRLHYDTDRPTVELKGDQLGQNVHFIALYVESAHFGIDKRLLAKGEGKNKVEAGNWAAIKAMYGSATKDVVNDLEQKVVAERERRKLQTDAKKKAAEQAGEEAAKVAIVKAE